MRALGRNRRIRRTGRSLLTTGVVVTFVGMSAGIVGGTVTKAATAARPAGAITVGNSACGTLSATPDTGVTGGYTYNSATTPPSQISISLTWNGTTSNTGCTVNDSEGPGSLPWYDFGTGGIRAGYWLIGLFCSTLAQSASNPQNDCDLQHGFVLTDYNSGPNNGGYNHGTSYNQCSTVVTLAGIISSGQTIPQCLTDGNTGGWTENWPLGHTTGTISGPMPESSSSTAWTPSGSSTPPVNCPPSQAEIAAGAVGGMCVFAVQELDWYYYCVLGICLPDFGNAGGFNPPNGYPNGENVNSKNYLATTFQYQQSSPSTIQPTHATGAPGSTFTLSSSGWGPAVGLATGGGGLTAQICGIGGVATNCSANSTVSVTEQSGGTLTGSGTFGSDVGTGCETGTCFVQVVSTSTQIENGWIGPWTFNSADITPPPPPPPVPEGYWTDASDGGVFTYGQRHFYGSTGNIHLNSPMVAMAPTPDRLGYWMVAADGGIFAFGDAKFYGSMGGKPLNKPIVSMISTADGKGYWMVATDGGIFAFGDAKFYGSMGGKPLNKPIVAMSPTADGKGYWMVASDGGIFAFGDAKFDGSMGGKPLNRPIVGMSVTGDGKGYWMVATDGGIFAFGDATFHGSMGGKSLNKPIVGMATTSDGLGYWMDASDGGIFSFGDAKFYGSMGGKPLNKPMVGMAA